MTPTPGPEDEAGGGAPVASVADPRPASVRAVDRLGQALSGRGLSRRRFLGRAAIVGAALAVDPVGYLLRPGSAYAQICGDGASCSAGWTAFCCTINNGANTCPPGSFVAGWWRIDDSPFCLGAARYVIDCNRSPGSSCSCRCASGTCDQRRVCCNVFRYGQCNTQIAGTTEVVCRVVTCTAPWDWDPACSRTVRVDNRTRSHNAPCLPGRDATPIAIRYQDLGMTGSVLGSPTSSEGSAAGGGRFRRYQNGTIFWLSSLGAHALYGQINDRHRSSGGAAGPLGYPRTDVIAVGDGTGLMARFQRGSIYRRSSSAGAVEVYDPIDAHYRGTPGGPQGWLGYPTSTARRSDGSTLTRFQNGILAAVGGRSVVGVRPEVLAAAEAPPASSPDRVGWPVAAQQASGDQVLQRFERGIVVPRTGGGWLAIGDDLAERYLAEGGPGGPLGRPTAPPRSVADGRGREVELVAGSLITSARGTWLLTGAMLTAYRDAGGTEGSLGLPTSEAATLANGQTRASFEGGAIVLEPDGTVSVVAPRAVRAPGDLGRTAPDGRGRRTARTPADLTDR